MLFPLKFECSWIFKKIIFLESALFHCEMFIVTIIKLILVNVIIVKKNLKFVKCQFLGIVKVPHHDNFGFVAKIMLMRLRFGQF